MEGRIFISQTRKNKNKHGNELVVYLGNPREEEPYEEGFQDFKTNNGGGTMHDGTNA